VVKTFYWNVKPNFGDALAPLLLHRFSKITAGWSNPANAELVLVGSILDQLPEDWIGVIAGAGKLHEETTIKFPYANILGVRGPLTAKGLRGDLVLADPGLLADELVPLEDKVYNLGVVAHWTDKTLETDPRFTKYNPKIIRVGDDPLSVIKDIGKCKKIVSSSLHGIIVADAFGIPRRIEISPKTLTHVKQEGGLFKWLDYSASINDKFEIGVTKEIDRNIILEKQYELYDMFYELKGIFKP